MTGEKNDKSTWAIGGGVLVGVGVGLFSFKDLWDSQDPSQAVLCRS